MIEKTKITLSAKELELVCNTDWILTKQAIIKKVFQLFGEVASEMQQLVSEKRIITHTPKIFTGEHYQDLPYVMLDYPRLFGKNETNAIRTFFWWGNFCSINLHLSGHFKTKATPKLIANFPALQKNDCSICINNTPWEHHFGEDNFVSAKTISADKFRSMISQQSFIKIAKKIPLHEWEEIPLFIIETFKLLNQFTEIMHQADGTNLSLDTPTIDSGL